jgi:hypothetical protein
MACALKSVLGREDVPGRLVSRTSTTVRNNQGGNARKLGIALTSLGKHRN